MNSSVGMTVKGVVDRVSDPHSQVTLNYLGGEHHCLFPTVILNGKGIDYPGALFEVGVTNEGGFEIRHLEKEEKAARQQAREEIDLSFLDKVSCKRRGRLEMKWLILIAACLFLGMFTIAGCWRDK